MTASPVSISMATYNGETYLGELLDSLARQTRPPRELVITDDLSSDSTPAILQAFADRAPFPVHVHRNERRLGYRANFLKAASLCTGELVAFCDQDDIWWPEKLAACETYFSQPDVLLLHHNARIVTANGAPMGVLEADMSDRVSGSFSHRPWEFALGFTMVFRAELLALNRLWMLSRDQNKSAAAMGHDQWFFFLASVFGRIARCGRCLVDYRQHGRNAFGYVHHNRWAAKWNYVLARRAEVFALCRGDMEQRAMVMRSAAAELADPAWRARALDAAGRFEQLTGLYADREALYGRSLIKERHAAFRHVAHNHGYDECGSWTFRRRAKVRDFVKGVLLGPILERFGMDPQGGDPECYPSGSGR